MEKALDIAFRHIGRTSPNPAVGAVVVKDGAVISSGGTCPAGSDHAEVAAIKAACRLPGYGEGESLQGTEIYVSLEPCSHYGKTPPCTGAIINAGIKRVHIPILDPNPLVAGKGVKKLEEAGVEVRIHHEYAAAAEDLIRPFKKLILRKKTYLVHKCAMTLDGKIAVPGGDSRWISSPFSRFLAHRLRQKVDAVIVGKNTLAKDNPALTARLEDFEEGVHRYFSGEPISTMGRENYFFRKLLSSSDEKFPQPLRVLVGIPDELNRNSLFLADENYMIFEQEQKFEKLLKKEGSIAAELNRDKLKIFPSSDYTEFSHYILTELADNGIMFAMLEGGSLLAGSFFDAGEIDQFLYVTAPKIIGSGISPLSGKEKDMMKEAQLLHDISAAMVGPDIVVNGYREKYNFEMM